MWSPWATEQIKKARRRGGPCLKLNEGGLELGIDPNSPESRRWTGQRCYLPRNKELSKTNSSDASAAADQVRALGWALSALK